MSKIKFTHFSSDNRGMVATAKIKAGEIIEVCPVIILPLKDRPLADKTKLFDYYFYWGPKNQPAIALGYGSLYNHSYEPNAEYEQDTKAKTITFTAIKDIKAGEEITVNYNGDPDSTAKLWFRVK